MLYKRRTPEFIKDLDKQERRRADVAQILGAESTRPIITVFGPYVSGESAEIIAFPEERICPPLVDGTGISDEVVASDNEVN